MSSQPLMISTNKQAEFFDGASQNGFTTPCRLAPLTPGRRTEGANRLVFMMDDFSAVSNCETEDRLTLHVTRFNPATNITETDYAGQALRSVCWHLIDALPASSLPDAWEALRDVQEWAEREPAPAPPVQIVTAPARVGHTYTQPGICCDED